MRASSVSLLRLSGSCGERREGGGRRERGESEGGEMKGGEMKGGEREEMGTCTYMYVDM